jgi:hypothetical protein
VYEHPPLECVVAGIDLSKPEMRRMAVASGIPKGFEEEVGLAEAETAELCGNPAGLDASPMERAPRADRDDGQAVTVA